VAVVPATDAARLGDVSDDEVHRLLLRCGVPALVQLLAGDLVDRARGGASRQALDTWWMPRAQAYFQALRTAFAPSAQHPRYLVIPNPDSLDDGTDEPTFLQGTDGVFTENWQNAIGDPTDWNLTVRRICQYVTGAAKVWMTDSTADVTGMPQGQRDMFIGTYMLIRNSTSYVMLLPGLYWYPEYEIDLGGYMDEPPTDIEQLKVAGAGGASGGLYARQEVAGTVLVNSSAGALTYNVPAPMMQAQWSGGGSVGSDGTEATQSLTYTTSVPAGPLSVPAATAIILRSPNGVPPAGVEPGSAPGDGGSVAADASEPTGGDGSVAVADDGGANEDDGGGPVGADGGSASGPKTGSSGGCGCRLASSDAPAKGLLALLLAMGIAITRRRRR